MQRKKLSNKDCEVKSEESVKQDNMRDVSALRPGSKLTNGQCDLGGRKDQMLRSEGDDKRESPDRQVELTDPTPRPHSDQYMRHQEGQTSHNTDSQAHHTDTQMPPVPPPRQRSAFSVAKKRPPGSGNSDDDDDSDEGRDVEKNSKVNGDDTDLPESQSTTASASVIDMADAVNADGTPSRKGGDGRQNEKLRKNYEESGDMMSEGPSREESIDIPMADDNQGIGTGTARRVNNRGNSQNKGQHSNPATPRSEHVSKIPRSMSNEHPYFSNANLIPDSNMGKKKNSMASLLDVKGRSPDDDAKSSFSGKSTLPR